MLDRGTTRATVVLVPAVLVLLGLSFLLPRPLSAPYAPVERHVVVASGDAEALAPSGEPRPGASEPTPSALDRPGASTAGGLGPGPTATPGTLRSATPAPDAAGQPPAAVPPPTSAPTPPSTPRPTPAATARPTPQPTAPPAPTPTSTPAPTPEPTPAPTAPPTPGPSSSPLPCELLPICG